MSKTNPIGFIKIHRKILEWEWYSDTNAFRLFMHLLLSANYEDKKFQGLDIKRGQLVVGRIELAKSTNLSEQQIRTALNRLKSTNEITIKTTNQFSIIELVNYNLYQDNKKENNQQDNQPINNPITNEQPTDNQRITTTKEVKKIKKLRSKENKEGEIFELPEFVDTETWNDFVEYRKELKAELTTRAIKLIIKDLVKFENNKQGNANTALENTIKSGKWTGVFEPKSAPNYQSQSPLGWLNK